MMKVSPLTEIDPREEIQHAMETTTVGAGIESFRFALKLYQRYIDPIDNLKEQATLSRLVGEFILIHMGANEANSEMQTLESYMVESGVPFDLIKSYKEEIISISNDEFTTDGVYGMAEDLWCFNTFKLDLKRFSYDRRK